MQEINFNYKTQDSMPFPTELVFNYLIYIPNFYHCSVDVEHFELINEQTASWVLRGKEDMGIKFQPNYIVEYQAINRNGIKWKSLSGNVEMNGEIQLQSIDQYNTKINVSESVSFVLPVSFIMSKIIKPIALNETRTDMVNFIRRVSQNIKENVTLGSTI